MSAISNTYSGITSSFTQASLLPPPPAGGKRISITKDTPGIVSFPDIDILNQAKKQAAEDQARIDAQRLSGEAGVQTDGNIYWVNGKNGKALIDVEDFTGGGGEDSTQPTNKAVSSFGSGMSENEIATTTENGTRVSVQSLPTNKTFGVPGAVVKLLNIETQGGLQIQMELDQNVRINDTENGGVSLFFPDTGETKRFDADGNVTTDAGEQSDSLEGSNGDDILVNINKSVVNAGEGNDTVFNFSENTIIEGGDGDDKIFLPGHSEDVIVNTGKGSNTVYGGQVNNAIINAQGNNDKIEAYSLHGTNITGTGTLAVNAKTLRESNLQSAGDFSANIGCVFKTRIQVGEENDQTSNLQNPYARLQAKANIVISGFDDSFLTTVGGDSSITMNSASNSFISTGGGGDTIRITTANNSSISTGGGNDTLRINHSEGSTIDMGDGNDTLVAIGSQGSKISMGNGDDVLVANSVGASTLDTGEGNDTLYYGSMHGVQLGIDATKDKIYHGGSGFVYNYFENPSQSNWDKMTSIAHNYEKTQLFKNYRGEQISMIFGSEIQLSGRRPLSLEI